MHESLLGTLKWQLLWRDMLITTAHQVLSSKPGSSLISKLTDLERAVFVFLGVFYLLLILAPTQFPENAMMISLCYCILSLVFSVFSLPVSKVDLISCELLRSQPGWNSHRFFFLPTYHRTRRELDTPCVVLTSLCSFDLICFPPLYPLRVPKQMNHSVA